MCNNKYTEDDYCDIYPGKICDNCGKCLENEGVDIRAIRIEDIAKNGEENKFLEDELKKAMFDLKDFAVEEDSEVEYSFNLNESDECSSDYIDAFENIVYLDDIGLDAEESLEDNTIELYPGVRTYSIKNKK